MTRVKLSVNTKKSGGPSKKKVKKEKTEEEEEQKIDPDPKEHEVNHNGSKVTVSLGEANSAGLGHRFFQSSTDHHSVPDQFGRPKDTTSSICHLQNCSNYQDVLGGSTFFQPANLPHGLLSEHGGVSTHSMGNNFIMRQQASQKIDETILYLSGTMQQQQQPNTTNASLAAILLRQLEQQQQQIQLQQQVLNTLGRGSQSSNNQTSGNLLSNTLDDLVSQLQPQIQQQQQQQLALGRLNDVHQQYEQALSQLATNQYQRRRCDQQVQPQQQRPFQFFSNNDINNDTNKPNSFHHV